MSNNKQLLQIHKENKLVVASGERGGGLTGQTSLCQMSYKDAVCNMGNIL